MQKLLGQTLLAAAYCVLGFGQNCWSPQTFLISPQTQKGDALFITKGSQGPWDGPKISIVNETDFEWWYFDANSKDGDQGIGVWFMNSNPTRWGLDLPTSNWFFFHARFADGSGLDKVIAADQVIINTVGEGSTGLWSGASSGWSGSADLSKFTLNFDIPEHGIKGIVDVTSKAPARSAIRPASDSEEDLMKIAGMGWAISVPAGDSTAHVTVGDKVIAFTDGGGYHDHNWGNKLPAWLNWYAIRAEVGPFIWTAIEAITGDGGYFKNSYLTFNGRVLLADLNEESLEVRPWGNGSEYPPKGFQPQPLGATIAFDAGEDGKYLFNITNHGVSPVIAIGKGLSKWFGSVTGGKVGGKQYQGAGMFEWLDFAF